MAKAQKNNPKKKAAPGKKSNVFLFGGIGVVFLTVIIWWGNQMPQGSIKYGICQAFIQSTLTYPMEFRAVSAYEKPNEVRMDYTTINEYGEYILKSVICTFKEDPVTQLALTEVQVERVKVPEEMIKSFNPTIPVFIENPPDLTLPLPPSNNLMDLQR